MPTVVHSQMCIFSWGLAPKSGLKSRGTSEFGPIDIIKGGQMDTDTMTSPTGLQKSHMESLNFSAFTILFGGQNQNQEWIWL